MEKLEGYLVFAMSGTNRLYINFLALAPIRDIGAKGKVFNTKKMAIQLLQMSSNIAKAHVFTPKEAKECMETIKDHETGYGQFYKITAHEALMDEEKKYKEANKPLKFNFGG